MPTRLEPPALITANPTRYKPWRTSSGCSVSWTERGTRCVSDQVAGRRAEREKLIELARQYIDKLHERLALIAAVVVGSVARGDFNLWSDIDVVVVSEDLPKRAPDRDGELMRDAPPRVQPVGFTPAEFKTAYERRNALVREAIKQGVVLEGEEFLATLRTAEPGA